MKRDIGAIGALCLLLSAPATAQMSMETVDACLTDAFSAQTSPNACVDLAHSE